MTCFGNASRQLCESLQGVRKTHPGHRKVRVGHKDCLVTMATTNQKIFIRISVKICNFICSVFFPLT